MTRVILFLVAVLPGVFGTRVFHILFLFQVSIYFMFACLSAGSCYCYNTNQGINAAGNFNPPVNGQGTCIDPRPGPGGVNPWGCMTTTQVRVMSANSAPPSKLF
jgi:hypothetical protein